MGYKDVVTLVTGNQSPAFPDLVRAALYAACARIGGGQFVDANQRACFLGLMNQVVGNPDLYVTAFAWILACQGLTASSTDGDLDTAMAALWPAVSGYIAAGG